MKLFAFWVPLFSMISLSGQVMDKNLFDNSFYGLSESFSVSQLEVQKPTTGIALTLMPLGVLTTGGVNPYPRFRVGLKINRKHFSYLLDVEYGNKASSFLLELDPFLFYGLRPEWRYHFQYHERGNVYCGVELALSYAERNIGGETYLAADGIRYQFDAATLIRNQAAAIIKIGGIRRFSDRLFADAYVGLGRGIRTVDYANEINRSITMIEETRAWFSSSDGLEEGTSGVPVIALGCRIGYWLK